jgi:ribonucleoside-diphosphate reductase alpha chain
VHDIICKIGECVVSGGVRRTAMISLSDLDDVDLRDAKKGQFFLTEPHRMVANNSAVYETRPSNTQLVEEWVALMKSGSGERGIFNRGALGNTLPKRRATYFKKVGFIDKDGIVHGPIGTNPCGEIILQSKQFCNLSEVIARAEDTHESLVRKARLASLLGTYQATLTKFKYISKSWTRHCKDESLLGVSVTGQWDSSAARSPETLRAMRDIAVKTNAAYAKRFGIKPSLSVTAVKPSGTVSQAFNCSSGIHPRHSKYYIRRVRISATDSLFKMLRDQGVPHYPEVGQSTENASTYVLEFPVESPDSTRFKDDFSALEQLEYWKTVKLNYTEHNPSATISVGGDEWIGVVDWIQKNWDIIGGLSFLPRFDHVYQLAPYETITREHYEELAAAFPSIDYSKLLTYEQSDETEQKRELACVGGVCDIDMVVPSGVQSTV